MAVQSADFRDQVFSGSVDNFPDAHGSRDGQCEHRLHHAIQTQVTKLEQFSQTVSSARTKLGGLMNGSTAAQNELRQGRPDAGRALVPVAGCGSCAGSQPNSRRARDALQAAPLPWWGESFDIESFGLFGNKRRSIRSVR